MRHLLLAALGAALFGAACASLAPDSPGRPNSASAMKNSQQDQPKDPHDFVADPTIGSAPPPSTSEQPLCHLQCGPHMHCDASSLVERCVRDEEPKP